MVSFLFWNIHKKPLLNEIIDVANNLDVDFLVLAECAIPRFDLVTSLNENSNKLYRQAPGVSRKLTILTAYESQYLRPIKDEGGISIHSFVHPRFKPLLLVSVHLPSKMYSNEMEQGFLSVRLARIIETAEAKVGHSRTLLMGDFNMNPFEPGLVSAEALHAVMDKRIAAKKSRSVHNENRKFFYNPMWNFLGDMNKVPGTYYYPSGMISYFWNTFDQILLRPDLLDDFQNENLKIITNIGSIELTKESGIPDLKIGSDHLPIFVSLDL